jgi:L-threonylcarbamoyladenylate synthase
MIGNSLEIAIETLLKGDLVAIPTETVYGLAGNALKADTVAKIFEAKNRPTFDPLIVHTYSIQEAKKYVLYFPDWAIQLANAFWPGPLTLLLPRNETIPDIVTNGSDLVAIRIPNHPLALALLKSLPFPLAAPSANPFGYISPTTAQHVADQLENKVSYILDGGACNVGVESTIVGIRNGNPAIFRTGGIAKEKIEKTLGLELEEIQSSSNPTAPGMLDSHYAPRKPLYIGTIEELVKKNKDKKIGIISFSKQYSHTNSITITLSENDDLNAAACHLFSALRELDKSDVEIILSEIFPNIGLGRAINDRLTRASFK